VATDEFRYIPEVVHECKKYLVGFGAEGIPDRFAFHNLPKIQTSTRIENFPSEMEFFLVWASSHYGPNHSILALIGDVEEFLAWAMGWCRLRLKKAAEAGGEPSHQETQVKPSRGMRVEEADRRARKLTKTVKMRKAFFMESKRHQARAIGCSFETWTNTPYYQEAVKRGWLPEPKKKDKSTAGSLHSVVSLTSDLEAAAVVGDRDEVLNKLVSDETAKAKLSWDDLPPQERLEILAEHEADEASDPSPLESGPRKASTRKRL
jgi:hypothetical protein